MQITVNGNIEEIGEKVTIVEFLESKKVVPNTVVIEHNYNILEKTQLENTILNDNDNLEIVKFMGGG
jgi:sulfur carrier protein